MASNNRQSLYLLALATYPGPKSGGLQHFASSTAGAKFSTDLDTHTHTHTQEQPTTEGAGQV